MRRQRATADKPDITRSGVIASVMQTKRKAQSPLERIRASCGFAPRPSVAASSDSQTKGITLRAKTSGRASGWSNKAFMRQAGQTAVG